MTYILDMVATVNYNFILPEHLRDYILVMVGSVMHNFVLSELLCDLHTGHEVIPPYE